MSSSNRSRNRFFSDRPRLLSLLLLCAVPLVLQFPALWRGEIPWFMDTLTYFYPLKAHAARLLARGELPLWNRTVFAGAPFLANAQHGLLYPGHWPMLLFPGPRAFTFINIAHIVLFGIGVFTYVRLIQGGRLAGAVVSGLLAELGGWTWAHLAFGSYLQVAAWMPWLLVVFEKCVRSQESGSRSQESGVRSQNSEFRIQNSESRIQNSESEKPGIRSSEPQSADAERETRNAKPETRNPKPETQNPKPETRNPKPFFWVAAAGVIASLQILAGAPQLALYCQAGLVCYAAVSWAVERRQARLNRAAGFLLGEGLIALGLSAPQWMPALAFQRICERADRLDLGRVMQGALDLRGLLAAWIGGTGMPEDAETILYPGILALALGCIGGAAFFLADRKRGNSATGDLSADEDLLEDGDLLADGDLLTEGDLLADGEKPANGKARPDAPNPLPALCVITVASVASWKLAVPFLYSAMPLFSRFHDPKRILFLAFLFVVVLAGCGFQVLWDRLPGRAGYRRGFLFLLGAVACLEPFFFSRFHMDAKTIPASQFEILVLSENGLRYRPEHPKAGTLFPIAPGERFFAQDIGIQYSYNYTRDRFGETLLPNLGALYGLEDVQGYDPLIPWRYAVYMRRLNAFPAPAVTLYPSHFGLVRNPDSPWLSRFGPLKARGPVDCFWPFFEPRSLRPGEQFALPLSRPWIMTNSDNLERNFRVYLTFLKTGESPPRLTFHLLRGDQAVGLPLQILPVADNEAEDGTGGLWPDVLPGPPGVGPVRRARVAAEKDFTGEWTGDRILLENHGPGPVLLYSLGLPQTDAAFKPTEDPDTFSFAGQPGFPTAVELHRMDVRAPQARDYYEKWAMRRSPDRVAIEIPPEVKNSPRDGLPVLTGWEFVEKRANRLRLALPENHPEGWVIQSEPFAPGWSCEVDGARATVFPADVLFRAVAVPADARVLTMRYWPPGLTNGLLAACATALIVLLLFLRQGGKSARDGKANGPRVR